MSGRWADQGGGVDSSQDFTQATQEESGLELDEYTQVEPLAEADTADREDSNRATEPAPWGRLMRLSGGSAVPLMPRPEQTQGRALNEVTLGRGKMCEVMVPDMRISSKHCRIYCETVSGHLGGTEVYVEDMSANGTWINQDMKLVRGQRRLLHSGDEISLLNPYKHRKSEGGGGAEKGGAGGAESGREEDDPEKEKLRKLEAEAATFTFINLNRNRGASHGRSGTLSVAETLRAGTVQGVSSPVLRSSASGVAGIFGGARKVEDFYDVREMIGHGTSGEVRRAINRTTGKQVAVKVIETRKFALTPGLTPKELVQEAEMLKRVDHEYIIKLEDIFQTEQAVYLVMDLVSGGDLFDRIVEKGVYAEDLAQELLFRVLTAVDYLHSQDIVHRDLKPENILLVGRDNDVDVKITDFGLAKRANKEGLKTFCGTPQYFAPEVLKRRNTVLGVGRYGKEADMWSVGVILYILLSGTHPFHTTTLFDQITHASYSMAGEEWECISDAAKDLVRNLLTESPDARLTADQALAHPFITQRAAAVAAAAVSTSSRGAANGVRGRGDAGVAAAREEDSSTAAAAVAGASSSAADDGRNRAGAAGNSDITTANGRGERGGGAVSTGGRSSSQDTEVSSASGAEDASPASRESLSPTEGGGGSAKAVPSSGPSSFPKDEQPVKDARPPPPPKGFVPDLPPPQPRELAGKGAGEGGGRGRGGAAAPRGRKRAKKENAGEKQKPSPPYSQLQVVPVRGGADQGAAGGTALSQEPGPGAGAACASSNGAPPGSAPRAGAGAGSGYSSNERAGGGASDGKAAVRARGNPGSHGRAAGPLSPGQGGQPRSPPARAGAGGSSNARGKRKTAAAADGETPAPAPGRQSSRRSPRRGGHGGAAGASAGAAAATSSLPADDEIMEYSSDDSPVKGKRARVCRGRQQDAAVAAASAARSKPAASAAAATGRGRAAVATPSASASAAAPAGGKRGAAKPNVASQPPATSQQQRQPQQKQQQHQQHQHQHQHQLPPSSQQDRGIRGGAKQMHLNFGDSGELNLSKLGPLARVGAGSAASATAGADAGEREREQEQERATGDRAAHAAAGGAAATLEDSVGGGAPAGNGGGASGAAIGGEAGAGKVGRSGGNTKKQPKGGSKPQRTMTHLWKRASAGQT